MKLARLAAVVVACVACKDDQPPRRRVAQAPPSAGDAGLAASELELVGCAPALPAPARVSARVTPERTTRLQLGALEVEGPVTKPQIADMFARYHNRFELCYEQRLVRLPALAGAARLTLTIKPNGRVFETHVEDSFDDDLSLCLKHIVAELEFPEAKRADDTYVTQAMRFAWKPPSPTADPPEPKAWTPFAASSTIAPAHIAVPVGNAAATVMPMRALEQCLGSRTGSFRSVLRIGIDGTIRAARTGGLGDKAIDDCLSAAFVGIETAPSEATSEIACDFQRADATAWRIAVDAGYTVIDASKGERPPEPADAEKTFLVLVEPTTPSSAIAKSLAAASRGAGAIVALRADAGPPLYVASIARAAVIADPATPVTLDTRDPLAACSALLDATKTGTMAEADKLLASASGTCTHRPCPAMLTITVDGERTAYELAALAGAARGADFERIVFGHGSCTADSRPEQRR